ncbi:zinc finger protein 91-like [Saccostrea echinata]|uniref:zinc finger protein 91-like n=1 Tax=Saccostrea echinata TaxID=191078 RepID=UPI002A7FAD2B|nr:zinc finger protein 91-like [Saccostrea echinata]
MSEQKSLNLEDSDKEKESLGLFVCGVCSTSFPNKRKLTFHLKKKHNQSSKIPDCELICYVCCKKFSQPYNLQRHLSRVHMKDKPFSCDRCGKTFSDKRTMLHHREYQHSEYRCALCGLSFDENEKLETHQCSAIFIEGSEKPYGCKICKKWFGNGSTLHLHVKTHSFLEEDCKLVAHYTCGVCTKVFKTRKEFNDHMKIHKKDQLAERKTTPDIVYHEPEKIVIKKIDSKNGKVLVECDVCGKNLSINSIQKHRKIHNGELIMLNCSVCEKVFSSSHNLQRHMNTVHMNKRSFCCEYCGKQFAEKATMLYHKYTRHAKNACKKCGISFESKSRLHKHECYAVLYDNGSKKPLYGCKRCKKYFVHRCKLHRHMKNHIDSGPKLLSARSKRLMEKFKNEETDGNNEMEDKKDSSDERGRSNVSSDNNDSDKYICYSTKEPNDDMKIQQKNLNKDSEMHPDLSLFHEPNNIAVKKIDPENGLVLVECDICGKTLSINSIQNHKKLHSGRQSNFKCSFCEKVLSNSHNLKRHINAVHMNERSFCCEYCGRLFKEKSSMTYHVNFQHSDIFCKSCGLSFENEFNLQEHECLAVLYDTGKKKNNFGCKKCEKCFSQRYKLHRHIWKHVRPKKISAKSKRLIEKFQNEEMEDDVSSSDGRGISSDNEISDSEMGNVESKERSPEARETLSVVSNYTNHNENSDKRAAGVLFCEICKEMFVCEDDFEHHQMWHEEVSLNTE